MLKLVARVETAAGLPPGDRSSPIIETRDPMDLETAAKIAERLPGSRYKYRLTEDTRKGSCKLVLNFYSY